MAKVDKKEYKVPSRKQPIFKIVKPFLKMIYRKPKIVYLDEPFCEKSIIISNHCSKKGPMLLEIHLPVFNVKWGAHEMLGNYKSRFHYMRDVYYMRKKGYGKFRATCFAGIESIFSKYFYKGMKMLPTYPDARFVRTVSDSMKVLDANMSIMLFPENSNKGYLEELTEFFPGFVMLAERYYKTHGEDIPITPIYYNDKKKIVLVDKKYYVQDFVKQGLSREEIAEQFRLIVNNLYHKTIEEDKTEAK